MALTGEGLTRWSIRLALGLYVIAVVLVLRRQAKWHGAARQAWTWGCVLYLCHVAFAFQFYHGWSHAAAYEATRAETLRVIGRNWGGGLYLNYVFAVLWPADAIWWWAVGDRRYLSRRGTVTGTVHGFFALMALNATVVFETGALRVAGLIASAAIIACAVRRRPRPEAGDGG